MKILCGYDENWMGREVIPYMYRFRPKDPDEVSDIVKSHGSDVPFLIGGHHAMWLDHGLCNHIDTRDMDRILYLDDHSIEAEIGTPLHKIHEFLEAEGYEIRSFTAYGGLTVGGTTSTGSHGTDMRSGTISGEVLGFTLILSNGRKVGVHSSLPWIPLQEYIREMNIPIDIEDVYNAGRCSLHSLGFMYSVRLKIYPISYHYESATVTTQVDQHLTSHPMTMIIDARSNSYVEIQYPETYPYRDHSDTLSDTYFTPILPLYRHLSRNDPGNPVWMSEYAIPISLGIDHIVEKVNEMYTYLPYAFRHALIRKTDGDDPNILLSPTLGEPCYWLDIPLLLGEGSYEWYDFVERFLMENLYARPHWGKIIMNPKRVSKIYGNRLGIFRYIRDTLDPLGIFISPKFRPILSKK